MTFLQIHWKTITMAGLWVWSRMRASLPALGTEHFFRVWAYDFLKGNSATKQPPV
jgi:hypothetical protein